MNTAKTLKSAKTQKNPLCAFASACRRGRELLRFSGIFCAFAVYFSASAGLSQEPAALSRQSTAAQTQKTDDRKQMTEGIKNEGTSASPGRKDDATKEKPAEVQKLETGTKAKAEISPSLKPVLKIEKTDQNFFNMELRNVDIQDFLRVLAYKYKLNIIMEKGIKGSVTASFSNISLEEALGALLETLGLVSEKQGNLIKIRPNLVSRTFTMQHIEAKAVYGSLSAGTAGSSKRSTIADLLSEDGKVFLGRIPNSLLVIDYPANLERVEDYLKMIDHRMASRVFKLKYLSAADIAGTSSGQTQITSSGQTQTTP